ncbi:polysaccharide pyruvyl transferase family protein [Adlercreutzia caecimuris]|uniref:polysaccharide pyruvyl transferase family protein n=1 Tax=Adlercreutzia caecimuris TaxID=671266 RepID=UPI001C3E67B9|nr:polysaccharide pyruvyl transferase family protein [Adlercreutzia caecimuris]
MTSIRRAARYLFKHGPSQSWRKYRKHRQEKTSISPQERPFNVLLLTNRDSDNVGDQVIEACDIALISTVMGNLGIKRFKINSRAAGIISQKYLATRDEKLLESALKAISEADVVVFGGAPLFNYRYQVFYERTAITLELARECNTPVIFSSIGVEGYDEDNEKCQRLKKTLNFDCVRQITTRDDFDSLEKFIEDERIAIGKVSDPAVFTWKVFERFVKPNGKKKVGVFIIRANAFIDNGIKFSRDDAAALWLDLIDKLEQSGYDYELLTSGHFGDEAFLDYLIKAHGVDAKKCVFNMNSPERLIEKISSYDAVVSCRLHPSIISFSLGVPSLGIVWNSKVDYFYDAIGYADRIINTEGINGAALASRLEEIIDEGVAKDESYLMSVYTTLFEALRLVAKPDSPSLRPYSYPELLENLVVFEGTSDREANEKVKRKFRRTYGKYNDLADVNRDQKKKIRELEGQLKQLRSR